MTNHGFVMTVTGAVNQEDLGITLTHEHVLCDLSPYWNPPADPSELPTAQAPLVIEEVGRARRNPFFHLDNLGLRDEARAAEEVASFRAAGGGTIVDLTPPDLARDPSGLKRISEATGVNIVMGCGHYLQMAHPAEVAGSTSDDIASRIVTEIAQGVGDSGIRPGVIGEIGMSNPLHSEEVKVLRGAARAHLATATPIAVHISPPPAFGVWTAHEVLDILEEEGVPFERVLLCHQDNDIDSGPRLAQAVEHHMSLADRGCFIGYDGCGKEHYFPSLSRASFPNFWTASDRERSVAVAMLVEGGYADRLLLSHDVCFKIELVSAGGFGYAHILRTFLSNLEDYGIARETSIEILTANPRRWLSGA